MVKFSLSMNNVKIKHRLDIYSLLKYIINSFQEACAKKLGTNYMRTEEALCLCTRKGLQIKLLFSIKLKVTSTRRWYLTFKWLLLSQVLVSYIFWDSKEKLFPIQSNENSYIKSKTMVSCSIGGFFMI